MDDQEPKSKTLNLYLDDSGTRHPSRKPGTKAAHGYDWFALGGILVEDAREEEARQIHQDFKAKWSVETPLHSSEIRSQNERFAWLRGLEKEQAQRFYEELYCMMRDAPVLGIACVVDRPGYNERYEEEYRENRWLLCKTAFSVVVERSAKIARSKGLKLRVFPEKCNRTEDRALKSYYDALRNEGSPFDATSSDKYAPMTQADYEEVLYELKFKAKTSPMAQLADLYLWPICMGGYHAGNRPYKRLMDDGKLVECVLDEEEHAVLATKYSCFENVERKK